MDQKKNLTPELAQIYDRVMKTPVQGNPTPPTLSQTPSQAVPPALQGNEFLSSVSPRPLNESTSKPFIFTGGKPSSPQVSSAPAISGTTEKKAISKPILVALGIIFVIVYALFFAKLFGLI